MCFGAALFAFLRMLTQRRPAQTLAATRYSLDRPGLPMSAAAPEGTAIFDTLVERASSHWTRLLNFVGRLVASPEIVERRLQGLGRSRGQLMRSQTVAILQLFVAFSLVVWVLGGGLLIVAPLFSLPLGVVWSLRKVDEEVVNRAEELRQALAVYSDLVVMLLAGGNGAQSALRDASRSAGGWTFGRLRLAVEEAELSSRPIWEVYSDLAAVLEVEEFTEFASVIELSESSGARLMDTLRSRSRALRVELRAEKEAKLAARGELVAIPATVQTVLILIYVGFGLMVSSF